MHLCEEQKIDVVLLCEKQGIEENLQEEAEKYNYQVKTVLSMQNDIFILAKENCYISVKEELNHLTVCKVRDRDVEYLLFIVHMSSALHKEENARNDALIELRMDIEQMELNYLGGDAKSVLVGDFNLQPYAHGVISARGLNATMSRGIAKRGTRTVDGKERKYFYNPMWALMGADREVQGTFYSSKDSKEESIYWYTLDQVLIRPELIDKFVMDELEIIDAIGEESLLTSHRVNGAKFSDHLPVVFELS